MIEFEIGDKVRVNEGLMEGFTGTVVDQKGDRTLVKLDGITFAEGDLAFFDQVLVPASEPHEALAHLKSLYPDFLKSDRYRFRITANLHGVNYVSDPLTSPLLEVTLRDNPPTGLERVEFMLKQDDSNRGLAWKLLWTA